MNTPLDDVAFLANSENRVAVFETLVEAGRSRDAIRERTDASRVTVTRILRELEAREWITGTGQEYEITPLGEWVHEAFTDLLDELAAERRLREPLRWLPPDLLTFDVRHLRDAEVLLVDGSDATVMVRRIVEFHRDADRIRGVAREVAPVFIENHWKSTVRGDTRLEMVVTPEVLDVVLDHPPSRRQLREMLDETNVDLSVSDAIPLSVGIVDGAVGINLTDGQGVIKGGLVTDDDTVHEWAVDLFEDCREQARSLEPDVVAL